jgi:phosphoribosylformylglycinamidine synthase
LGSGEVVKVLAEVVADAEVACQRYADAQYDSTVGGNTRYGPHYGHRHRAATGYWAATPLEGSPAAVVVATAFNPWLFDIHPVRALRQMFCGLLGRLVLAGVALGDVCLCDNFYTPHLSEHADAWLVGMVDELAMLVRRFGTPVISGKDSSAGSTPTGEGLVHVPPAVFLSALGKAPDVSGLLDEAWSGPGSVLVRIGPACPSPAGTVAARVLGLPGNVVDDIDLAEFRHYLDAVAQARHLLRSATTIGPGGVAARLVTGALAAGLGVDLDPGHTAQSLFAEHRCGALVEVPADLVKDLPTALNPTTVGRLRAAPGLYLDGENLLSAAVAEQWSTSFATRIM